MIQQRMPSPYSGLVSSPDLAPQSAATSLGKKPGTFHSHSLRPPSADECKHDRQHSELPMLPCFHPAKFPTPQHGNALTISPGIGRRQAQLGSQSRHKQIGGAQKRLKTYQYEVLDLNEGQSRKPLLKAEPSSPKLQPTTLSGPVTPLALERHESYFSTGSGFLGVKRDVLKASDTHGNMTDNNHSPSH